MFEFLFPDVESKIIQPNAVSLPCSGKAFPLTNSTNCRGCCHSICVIFVYGTAEPTVWLSRPSSVS